MKLIKYSLIIILSLISQNIFAEMLLTQQTITHMLKKVEVAVKTQNADRLMSHFSDYATITMDMPANLGGKIEVDVDTYKNMLEQGWASPAKFTYESQDLVINVAPDGKSAIATDISIETVEFNGKVVMSSRTKEKITIRIFDGEPIISTLYGKVEIL